MMHRPSLQPVTAARPSVRSTATPMVFLAAEEYTGPRGLGWNIGSIGSNKGDYIRSRCGSDEEDFDDEGNDVLPERCQYVDRVVL